MKIYIWRIKKLPHKTLRVHSARYTQCIHASSRKLKLPKDTHTERYKQLLPTHPFPKIELYIAVKCTLACTGWAPVFSMGMLQHFCLCLCLSVCMSVWLPVYVCLSELTACLCLSDSTACLFLSVYLPVSVCLTAQSLCLSICLSLSVCLSLSLSPPPPPHVFLLSVAPTPFWSVMN